MVPFNATMFSGDRKIIYWDMTFILPAYYEPVVLILAKFNNPVAFFVFRIFYQQNQIFLVLLIEARQNLLKAYLKFAYLTLQSFFVSSIYSLFHFSVSRSL